MNKSTEAIAAFTKAIEQNPRDATAYFNRGQARSILQHQHGHETIEHYGHEETMEMDARESGYYKMADAAIGDLKTAFRLGYEPAPVYDELATAFRAKNEWHYAEQHMQFAVGFEKDRERREMYRQMLAGLRTQIEGIEQGTGISSHYPSYG